MEKATKFMETISLPKFERKELLPIISITAATTIFFASYKFIQSGKRKETKKKIPVPNCSYPYVGHLLSLGDLPGMKIAEWHKELGPIINVRMGVQNWIMLGDPILAHKIFVVNGAETSFRPISTFAAHYSLGGKGLVFSQPDTAWKDVRSAALSVLAPKQISNYMHYINKESDDLVARFMEATKKEGGTNPLKYLELNSLNIIFSILFGRTFESVEDPDFIEVSKVIVANVKFAGLENDLASFFPILSIIDYFAGTQAKMQKFIKERRDPFYKRMIKEARAIEGQNVVKSLGENGFNLSEEDILVFISDVMGAGTDTVSVSLTWNIALMCNYPDIQKKASKEIDEFIKLNGRLPLFSERTQLPYCICIIKESMRFKSTTSFGVPHSNQNEFEVDGYIIPKESVLVSNMESMHKNPDVYPEPEKFIPERFMNNLKTMQSAANGRVEERDHYNFGWGRRMCPAIYLAEVEIFLAFTRIFSKCIVEPTDEGMPDIKNAINGGVANIPLPYKVKFTKRIDSLV